MALQESLVNIVTGFAHSWSRNVKAITQDFEAVAEDFGERSRIASVFKKAEVQSLSVLENSVEFWKKTERNLKIDLDHCYFWKYVPE